MISLLIFTLFLTSASASLPYASYFFNIVNYGGSSDYLRVYGFNNTLLANIDLPVSQRSSSALWLDLSQYPIKVIRTYVPTQPVYIFNPQYPYDNVELSFFDATTQWNKISFRRGSNVLVRGKYNLLEDANVNSANYAHGHLGSGIQGFSQGKFPACNSQYQLSIAYVNTNDLVNPSKNTLSCDTITCSYLFISSSPAAASYYPNSLYFVANTTIPTGFTGRVSGLSTLQITEATAYCDSGTKVNNVYYAKNPRFTKDLDLFVTIPGSGQPVINGKPFIVQNSVDPPVSEITQASINLGLQYPLQKYIDAL